MKKRKVCVRATPRAQSENNMLSQAMTITWQNCYPLLLSCQPKAIECKRIRIGGMLIIKHWMYVNCIFSNIFFHISWEMCFICAKHDVLMPATLSQGTVDGDMSCARKGFSSLKCCVILCHCHMFMRVPRVEFSWVAFLLCIPYFLFFFSSVLLINCIAEHTQFKSQICLQMWLFYTSLRSSCKMINEFCNEFLFFFHSLPSFLHTWLRKLKRIRPIGKMGNEIFFRKNKKKSLEIHTGPKTRPYYFGRCITK